MAEKNLVAKYENESLGELAPIVATTFSSLAEVEKESGISRADMRHDSLLRVILTYVVGSHYGEALRAIEDYMLSRYPS